MVYVTRDGRRKFASFYQVQASQTRPLKSMSQQGPVSGQTTDYSKTATPNTISDIPSKQVGAIPSQMCALLLGLGSRALCSFDCHFGLAAW